MYGGAPATFPQPANTGYPQGNNYSPGPPLASHHAPPGYLPNPRPGRNGELMYYDRDDLARQGDAYRQPPQFPGAPLRDSRMADPHQPRYMPPMESMDPQRMHRAPTQGYHQPYIPGQDVHMQDGYDDFEPPRQNRNPSGYPAPTGRMPEGYDYRGPPNQGPYVQRNPREEDRYQEKRRGPGKY